MTPEKNGGYSVSFPNVPAALTCGDDRDEALAMAEDALTVALGSYMQCREDIPVPDTVAGEQEMVAVPLVVAAKLALYTAMREQGLTKERS
ncbi:type II toxin-antitoxin system HicB family antitoxin [Candidatus Palauibacter sp.]|uniref:type II toxin-antitoxin system HicB family antitoxin n=1 Tax=Candidatus Palauibacter sp. TaxID=3101350 RepID=UPI003B5ABCCB